MTSRESVPGRTAIVVTAWRGQPHRRELELAAARGERPRVDYVELARRLDADVVDAAYQTSSTGRAARALATHGRFDAAVVADVVLRRGRYGRVVAWSDRAGALLALVARATRAPGDLVLISVRLVTPRKAAALRRLALHRSFRAIVMYGSRQRELAARLGVPRSKLHLALQPVDERFWRPEPAPSKRRLCAVGWEARDYATLADAVAGLDVDVEVAIGSSVGGAGRTIEQQKLARLPANVTVRRGLSPLELRSLYARSAVVVVPLVDVDYDAGVTALTEAMAMARPVVATRTRGQRDVLRHEQEGLYVPPGDAAALRGALERLLGDAATAERMGRAGRAAVESRHTLDAYVDRLASVVSAGQPAGARGG
jgi:glycosyltransferase involved in cell wall biosynthesis